MIEVVQSDFDLNFKKETRKSSAQQPGAGTDEPRQMLAGTGFSEEGEEKETRTSLRCTATPRTGRRFTTISDPV